ncbi:MAG: RidA family protein [Nitrospiraceae bacterium]
MSFEQRVIDLGLTLPTAPKPVANYIPAVRVGDLIFLSGVLPMKDGHLQSTGKLGREVTVAQGQAAAKQALLNALAIVRQEMGDLEQVRKIVRLTGHVASHDGFTEQPAVMNGASDLLVQIFGETGRHARVAVGAAELPLNASVELEMIVQVHSGS